MKIRATTRGFTICCSDDEFATIRGGCTMARSYFDRNVRDLTFVVGVSDHSGSVQASDLDDCRRQVEKYSAIIAAIDASGGGRG